MIKKQIFVAEGRVDSDFDNANMTDDDDMLYEELYVGSTNISSIFRRFADGRKKIKVRIEIEVMGDD